MIRNSTSDLVFSLVLLSVLVWWYSIQFRYYFRRYRAKRWPIIVATLQKGAMGGISVGKGASIPAAVIGYSYMVEGVRYAGFFAPYGDVVKAQTLLNDLQSHEIQIRYNPSDLKFSFLSEFNDPRFQGLTATQNPARLSNCPAFDLQDALR
jgi:hypothetical protein